MSGAEIVALSKRHTMTEWSPQAAANPIPIDHAKGSWFWTPEGDRFLDFNSQLMCTNIGHGDERVLKAITDQAAKLAYANPFMATEPRARLGAKLAEICPGDIDACYADPTAARELLGWQATRDLAAMCADSWRWQSLNPQGYTPD